MPYNYRWALGEDKAKDLAKKVSKCDGWRRCESFAHCGDVTCELRYAKTPDDDCYKEYWLCYQRTSQYPNDESKYDTTIGFCTDRDFPQLAIQRLKDGLERIYR